jgi:Glycosyl transferases group 1
MRIGYVGNFIPEHSTENHVREAWERRGQRVIRIQEGDPAAFDKLMDNLHTLDLVLWTRTADLAAKWGHKNQWRMLSEAKRLGVPTAGFHLDRWWGLDREAAVWTEPFFRCDYVITADGGHDGAFRDVGVNHIWLPPAVSLGECEPGEYREEYASDIAFVGSWQPGYHAEWTHRPELVRFLKETYPKQMRFWPRPGQPSIRGKDLRDLYASGKVVVGDSCLVGGATRYWSDRIPETIGRGGFLIHPYVSGIEDHFNITNHDGKQPHLLTWNIGDWEALNRGIQWALLNPEERQSIADAGRAHVRTYHTYDFRVEQIADITNTMRRKDWSW